MKSFFQIIRSLHCEIAIENLFKQDPKFILERSEEGLSPLYMVLDHANYNSKLPLLKQLKKYGIDLNETFSTSTEIKNISDFGVGCYRKSTLRNFHKYICYQGEINPIAHFIINNHDPEIIKFLFNNGTDILHPSVDKAVGFVENRADSYKPDKYEINQFALMDRMMLSDIEILIKNKKQLIISTETNYVNRISIERSKLLSNNEHMK
ncbi:MAG: hypothetical protein ACK4OM_00565 [Alphaproteobacteria bacterium]